MTTIPCTGHLRVNPRDPRYLADGDGRTWIAHGANIAFVRSWSDPAEALARLLGWIDRIAENGGNCARVWLSQPLLEPEQERVGSYAPEAEERLRALLARARRRGVRLKLCLEHARRCRRAAASPAGRSAACRRPGAGRGRA